MKKNLKDLIKVPKLSKKEKKEKSHKFAKEGKKAVEKKDRKNKEKKKFNLDINIKLQLLVGFAIPVFLVVLVGVMSYNKAEEGMITNYEVAAKNTIDTQMDYLDFGFYLIRGDISQLKLDLELQACGMLVITLVIVQMVKTLCIGV